MFLNAKFTRVWKVLFYHAYIKFSYTVSIPLKLNIIRNSINQGHRSNNIFFSLPVLVEEQKTAVQMYMQKTIIFQT